MSETLKCRIAASTLPVKGGNWIFELNEIRGELKFFNINGGRKRGGKRNF